MLCSCGANIFNQEIEIYLTKQEVEECEAKYLESIKNELHTI